MDFDACPVDLDGYSALLDARNKFVTAHLALHGLMERDGHSDELSSVERVLDEAMRDLDHGLKLNEA